MAEPVWKLRARQRALQVKLDNALARKAKLDDYVDRLAKALDIENIEIAVAEDWDNLVRLYPPKVKEDTMAVSSLLQGYLAREHMKVRKAFFRLTPLQQGTVELEFRRHAIACRNHGVEPDPHFLNEVITDIKRGVHNREEAYANAA